ncbi:MAG: hypothetical protein Q7R73_04900, partial [bacterium]|nr:hypothetical protein [bacterium]
IASTTAVHLAVGASGSSITTPFAGNLDMGGNDITNVRGIFSANGTWSIGEDGTLRAVKIITEELIADNIKVRLVEAERVKAAEVEVNEFRVFRPVNAEEATVGEGRILRGDIETTIYSSRVASTSKIFVSFTSDLQGRSYFVDKSNLTRFNLVSGETAGEAASGSVPYFKVKISSPLPDDATFDWWVVSTRTDANSMDTQTDANSTDTQTDVNSATAEVSPPAGGETLNAGDTTPAMTDNASQTEASAPSSEEITTAISTEPAPDTLQTITNTESVQDISETATSAEPVLDPTTTVSDPEPSPAELPVSDTTATSTTTTE